MDKQNLLVMEAGYEFGVADDEESTIPAVFYRAFPQEHQSDKEAVRAKEALWAVVEMPPKRTIPAVLHARHVGRAKPVVTLDFVDDEIIDW